MSDLPDSWTTAPFLSVADLLRGVTYSKGDASSDAFADSIPVLRANNIQDRKFDLTDLVHVSRQLVSAQQLVRQGDVVVATSSGSISVVGKAARAAKDMDVGFGAFCGLLRPKSTINPAYFGFFFSTDKYRRTVSALARGVNINNLKREHFESLQIPLPPLAEQKRIADKLEAVLGRVEACRSRLDRVPDLLKRFRQSVLAAATSGKLTEDWRLRHPDENAIGLIEAAAATRHHLYKDHSPRCDLPQHEIPDSWAWASLRFILSPDEAFCYGVVQPGENDPNGSLLIRAGDLVGGRVDFSELRRIPQDVHEEYHRSHLRGGELLVTVVGAGIGTTAIAQTECAGCNIARAVAKLPIRDFNARFVHCWLSTSHALSWLKHESREVARPTLNLEQLQKLPVPIPPLAEQAEIVRRVEALFALADQIEARLTEARTHVERLTPATLAKAFRGELVPQDPQDEPASVLLERLRQTPTSPEAAAPRKAKAGRKKREVPTAPEPPAVPVAVTTARAAMPTAPPGAEIQLELESVAPAPQHTTPARVNVEDLDKEDLMSLLREVLQEHGPCDRDTAIQQAAHALGYKRTGSVVTPTLDNAIRTAVRRRVLFNEGGELRVNRASIADMEAEDRPFMKEQFLAAISQGGRAWIEREDAARLFANWFGYRRTGHQIQDRVKSLINGLIRDQALETDGSCIRRV